MRDRLATVRINSAFLTRNQRLSVDRRQWLWSPFDTFTWYMRCVVGGDSSASPLAIVRSSAATGVGGRHSGGNRREACTFTLDCEGCRRGGARRAFDSYKSFAGDIWLPWLISWAGMRPWTIIPTAGVTTWQYDAPDPFVAPFTTAHITEWRVGLGVEVPNWRQLALGSLLQYRNATSNVAAFSYRDLSISAGPLIRF